MRKSTTFLTATVFFLLGIILGFILAPVKNGVSIGNNNNGNNYSNKNDEDFDDVDEYDCISF